MITTRRSLRRQGTPITSWPSFTRISIRIKLRAANNETEQYKMQFEQAMSLVETQKLSIKLLQDELGEEAEFDAEETAQLRSVRRECETRVNN